MEIMARVIIFMIVPLLDKMNNSKILVKEILLVS